MAPMLAESLVELRIDVRGDAEGHDVDDLGAGEVVATPHQRGDERLGLGGVKGGAPATVVVIGGGVVGINRNNFV